MRHFSSERLRGNTSIVVLGLMMLITSITLGHNLTIQTLIKGGRALPSIEKKAKALGNAVQEIRIDGHRNRTETTIAGEDCSFHWQTDHRDGVQLERIDAHFPDHPGWPRVTGLWIHANGLDLLINDFRHE